MNSNVFNIKIACNSVKQGKKWEQAAEVRWAIFKNPLAAPAGVLYSNTYERITQGYGLPMPEVDPPWN